MIESSDVENPKRPECLELVNGGGVLLRRPAAQPLVPTPHLRTFRLRQLAEAAMPR